MFFEVFSLDRQPLGIVEGYSSMQWVRRYHSAGEFELHIAATPRMVDLLKLNNLIVKGTEAGVIKSVRLTYDVENGDQMEVKGCFLAGCCEWRVLWGTYSLNLPQESVMTELAKSCLTQGDRALPGLAIAPSGGRGESIEYQDGEINLLDALEETSEAGGIGFCIDFAPDGLLFRTYTGLDRSSGQDTNPRAIFSRAGENILSQEYEEDAGKHKNVALVTYEKNDVETVETVGEATGWERREIVIKGSKLDKDENKNELTDTQRRALMREQGAAKLATYAIVRALSAEADPNGNLRYKTDYDLGDIITVDAPGWGVAMDARITEIKEIYEAGGMALELTFGKGMLSFRETVRRYANG